MDRTIHGTTKELGCKLYDQNGPKNATNAREPPKKFCKSLTNKEKGTHQKQMLSNKTADQKEKEHPQEFVYTLIYIYSYIVNKRTIH